MIIITISEKKSFNNDLRKFGGQISKSGARSAWSSPILFNFKLAVANDFTNALEIKTTRMRREYCWEDAYAKIPFCVTRPSTAILSVQSPNHKVKMTKYVYQLSWLCIHLQIFK